MLIHEMMLIALVDFFALKYRQAKRKGRFKFEIGDLKVPKEYYWSLSGFFSSLIFLKISSILNT